MTTLCSEKEFICVNAVERACLSCMHSFPESTKKVDALLIQKQGGGVSL